MENFADGNTQVRFHRPYQPIWESTDINVNHTDQKTIALNRTQQSTYGHTKSKLMRDRTKSKPMPDRPKSKPMRDRTEPEFGLSWDLSKSLN